MEAETFARQVLGALARSSQPFWPSANPGALRGVAGLVAALQRPAPVRPGGRVVAAPRSDAARQRARSREDMRALVQHEQQETIRLLHQLDLLAAELFQYADSWDRADPSNAAPVWRQAQLLHAIRARAVKLAEEETADMSAIVAEVNTILRQIRHDES